MSRTRAPAVPPQYASARQRDLANHLGMWTLIATEILFFGGLFLAYAVYRHAYPEAFAEGSSRLDFWRGTVNTAVLLTSSLAMAVADAAIRAGRRPLFQACIGCTGFLGLVFLAVKFSEYHEMYRDHLVPGVDFHAAVAPQVELFVFLYFVMTGLHALHMVAGLAALGWLLWRSRAGGLTAGAHAPVSMVGLYWHFVDCVWVFLYPLLYLIPR
jgi:cytochrome c oxidase subunit 3